MVAKVTRNNTCRQWEKGSLNSFEEMLKKKGSIVQSGKGGWRGDRGVSGGGGERRGRVCKKEMWSSKPAGSY